MHLTFMKQILLFIVAVLISLCSYTQIKGPAKIYGYKEPVSSGNIPKRIIDENGKETSPEKKPSYNYFIYLVSAGRAYPSEMWIMSKPYSVIPEFIKNTPVERKNFNIPSEPKSTVLVPKTTKKVLLLTPAPAIDNKLTNKAKNLAKTNELVIVYKSGGKFYYNSLKFLTRLELAVTQ